jgi:hypothetical protein
VEVERHLYARAHTPKYIHICRRRTDVSEYVLEKQVGGLDHRGENGTAAAAALHQWCARRFTCSRETAGVGAQPNETRKKK